MADLLRSPLHERHLALGARMAEFSGWLMPVEYPGGGVLREHAAVRTTVGVFDVSHLGKGTVRGPGARTLVQDSLTADLGRIEPGQAQYTLCCDDATGGVVDDLIAYLRADDDVLVIPNAANTAEVLRLLAAAAPPGITVDDLHRSLAVLAVQGPASAAVLSDVGLPAEHDYMSFVTSSWREEPVVVCRSGYTGERGFEVVAGWEQAPALWDAVLAAVRRHDGLPCGLGARDTLRTEMGYPLHGHELSLDISPVQARAGWAVGWDKPRFWGRTALLAERAAGTSRLLWGLVGDARTIPRAHMQVRDAAGSLLGEVTSGTFSPTLRRGIGLALLDRGVSAGDEVVLDLRGRAVGMSVVRPPFVTASPR